MTSQAPVDVRPKSRDAAPWRDANLSPTERADALIPAMTLEEKVASPGDVELRFGRSSSDVAAAVPLRLLRAVARVERIGEP